jgi:hypothetical protein
MNYDRFFADALLRVREEQRYPVFADLERFSRSTIRPCAGAPGVCASLPRRFMTIGWSGRRPKR